MAENFRTEEHKVFAESTLLEVKTTFPHSKAGSCIVSYEKGTFLQNDSLKNAIYEISVAKAVCKISFAFSISLASHDVERNLSSV